MWGYLAIGEDLECAPDQGQGILKRLGLDWTVMALPGGLEAASDAEVKMALSELLADDAPTAGPDSAAVDEDGTVHLTGTYSDTGTQDTHTLTIDWGEGDTQTDTVTDGLDCIQAATRSSVD